MKRLRVAFAAIALAALAVPAALPAATRGEDAVKYRADLDEGIGILKSGNRDEFGRAIAKFKSALKLDPESSEAYYWIALAYSDLGSYVRAADNAKDATVYDNAMSEAWSLWGQTLLYQRQYEDARAKLETALRLDPEDPIILYNLGRVFYHGMKDPTAALPNFRAAWQRAQALRRDNPAFLPLAVGARLYMGLCEFDRGAASGNYLYYENAIKAFQDVLQDQPTNYDAAMRLAMAYRRGHRAADARNLLAQIHDNLEKADPAYVDRQLFAEINLQLADIYLKDPALKNRLMAVVHLRKFVDGVGDSNHPALEPAKRYLAQLDEP